MSKDEWLRLWTLNGYMRRYGDEIRGLQAMKKDCLTGMDTGSGEILDKYSPFLRKFVCANYIRHVYNLINSFVFDADIKGFNLRKLRHIEPEIAEKIEALMNEIETYAIGGMAESEQGLFMKDQTERIFTEFIDEMY
jgi:hypothetical protein